MLRTDEHILEGFLWGNLFRQLPPGPIAKCLRPRFNAEETSVESHYVRIYHGHALSSTKRQTGSISPPYRPERSLATFTGSTMLAGKCQARVPLKVAEPKEPSCTWPEISSPLTVPLKSSFISPIGPLICIVHATSSPLTVPPLNGRSP